LAPKKAREEIVKSMLIILFDTKLIVHKEFVLAGHTVNSAYYCAFYGECMKMWEDFALTLVTKELSLAS
jgi:hypothetical protein